MTDKQINYQSKNLQNAYLFLEKEVYPYTFCYIYGTNKNTSTLGFATNRNDFIHMCGLKYKGKHAKSKFIEDVSKQDIDYKRLWLHADGTSIQKITVINILPCLFNSLNVIVSDQKQTALSFNYDGYIATNKRVLSLGLKRVNDSLFVPQTLLNLHNNKVQPSGQHVHVILRKNRKTGKVEIVKDDGSLKIKKLNTYFSV